MLGKMRVIVACDTCGSLVRRLHVKAAISGAVVDVSGEDYCCAPKSWRHLRLQEHATYLVADGVN